MVLAATEFCRSQEHILRRMMELNSFTENAKGVTEVAQLTSDWFRAEVDQSLVASMTPSTKEGYGKHLALRSQKPGNDGPMVPVIAMVSHLDTVYPPNECWEQSWTEEHDEAGSWIVGPGSMDIKGGTFMIATVLHTLKTVHPNLYNEVDFAVLLNASEEVMADDFVHVCRRAIAGSGDQSSSDKGLRQRELPDCLGCLAFEAGKFADGDGKHTYTMVSSRKGMFVWEVNCTGLAAHAGNNHKDGWTSIFLCSRVVKVILTHGVVVNRRQRTRCGMCIIPSRGSLDKLQVETDVQRGVRNLVNSSSCPQKSLAVTVRLMLCLRQSASCGHCAQHRS